jgi:hypothetical protein
VLRKCPCGPRLIEKLKIASARSVAEVAGYCHLPGNSPLSGRNLYDLESQPGGS